ncbi:MAG: MOSC N-terminal beta barrel domain-containing protein [Patescibacteria group bacterium]
MAKVEVSGLTYYPVKSLAGVDLKSAEFSERGLLLDRHWMIVDKNGIFLTQRELPNMARIHPQINYNYLVLEAESVKPLIVPLYNLGVETTVEIWGRKYLSIDDGREAAEWLKDFLGTDCRLVHMSKTTLREKKLGYGRFEFADSYPLTVVSQESLEDLNERIKKRGEQPVSMNRFRPNIVITGCQPYEEDFMALVQINNVTVHLIKPDVRCRITTVNQENAKQGKEPLTTLATFRSVRLGEKKRGVIFAQKAVNLTRGKIRVEGDNQVEILARKDVESEQRLSIADDDAYRVKVYRFTDSASAIYNNWIRSGMPLPFVYVKMIGEDGKEALVHVTEIKDALDTQIIESLHP